MTRRPRRPWLLGLVLFLCAAVLAAGAGVVLGSRDQPPAAAQPGGTAAPSAPAPGKTQTQADLAKMQSLLNTGSVSQQAALLMPPMQFSPGSGPIFPGGKNVTILPGTLHSSGQQGTVQAHLSDGTAVTLGLYSASGHWRLYAVQTGSAQTSAKVTGQPAGVRLLSDQVNPQLDPSTVGKAWPVIFVHGFHQGPNDWGQVSDYYRTSMAYQVHAIPGAWVSFFNYGPTSTNWVDDPSNGPALARYVHAVAQASQAAHGPGKVILVGFSMGGLMARFVAATSMRAADIAMVTTIGTPHEGTSWGNVFDLFCGNGLLKKQADRILGPGACEQWSAPRGMTAFSADISRLGELPTGIALHEIAGDETLYKVPIAWATVDIPLHGDGVAYVSSALHKRPGWARAGDTFDTVTNPHVLGDVSAWHLELQANQKVISLVTGYVAGWIQAHPAPVQAAPTAPASTLGGDAYWLADGGTWTVHGMQLQISRGSSGLVGTQTWNAGGNIEIGHAQLAFTSNADGSLTGTYIATGRHTYTKTPPAGFIPEPDADLPQQGQMITLVPVSPHLAKTVYNGNPPALFVGGNTNLCQADLPNASQYCGA